MAKFANDRRERVGAANEMLSINGWPEA